MGCCGVAQAPKTRAGQGARKKDSASSSERQGHTGGYTIEQFVKDNLVPVEGFACRQPRDPKREKDLRREVKDLNEKLDAFLKMEMLEGDKMPQTERIRRDAIPLEAICRIRLESVTVQGNQGKMFDFHQSSNLEVKLFGRLLFPPDAD